MPVCTFMFRVSLVPSKATVPPPRTFHYRLKRENGGIMEQLLALNAVVSAVDAKELSLTVVGSLHTVDVCITWILSLDE